MVRLTEQATAAYEDYIRKGRAYLAAAGADNPEELIADLREHVDRELAGLGEPVSEEAVQRVLARLGEPRQWIGEEELSWWRKFVLRIRTGPEDWRLAYATFGLVLGGVLFGWLFCDTYTSRYSSRHDFNWEAMALFLAVSFILARAALAVAKPSALSPGQKWLVYPSLILPYVVIALLIIAWAPMAAGAGGFALSWMSLKEHAAGQPAPGYYPSLLWNIQINPDNLDVRAGIFAAWAGTLAAGVWWTLLGVLLLFGRARRAMAGVFAPFLQHTSRKWSAVGLIAGWTLIALAIVAAVAAYEGEHVYF